MASELLNDGVKLHELFNLVEPQYREMARITATNFTELTKKQNEAKSYGIPYAEIFTAIEVAQAKVRDPNTLPEEMDEQLSVLKNLLGQANALLPFVIQSTNSVLQTYQVTSESLDLFVSDGILLGKLYEALDIVIEKLDAHFDVIPFRNGAEIAFILKFLSTGGENANI